MVLRVVSLSMYKDFYFLRDARIFATEVVNLQNDGEMCAYIYEKDSYFVVVDENDEVINGIHIETWVNKNCTWKAA